jgi:glycosyltransferase involved in cell wall biosynthesis
LGLCNNVEEFLQAADLFVFPTENDAFPSSVVEAMAVRSAGDRTTPVGAIKTIVRKKIGSGSLLSGNCLSKIYCVVPGHASAHFIAVVT